VQVTLVPSSESAGQRRRQQFLTTYLINDRVAVDAGCLGLHGTPADQAKVRHLFLTHSHLDHVASLPSFLENVYCPDGPCVTVHGNAAVLDSLRRDLFNDRVWPDFIRLSEMGPPFLRLHELRSGQTVEAEGLRVTAVAVHHSVPTLGYLFEDESAAVVLASDTGPTSEIWERANALPNLRAVFLEASFPDAMRELAEKTGHLTPALFREEVRKLTRPARLIAVHIKAAFRERVVQELSALKLPNFEVGRFGRPYSF
jgi:ribonuclease BN (tRNA processing enzyme)